MQMSDNIQLKFIDDFLKLSEVERDQVISGLLQIKYAAEIKPKTQKANNARIRNKRG